MQRLAAARGESNFIAATAPAHLVTVLTELVADQLEHTDVAPVAHHGTWLAATPLTSSNLWDGYPELSVRRAIKKHRLIWLFKLAAAFRQREKE